jgi:hypothetical protein
VINSLMPFNKGLHVLDNLHYAEPDLIASLWYAQAMSNGIRALQREWKQQFSAKSSKVKQAQTYIPSMYCFSRTT